MCCTVKQLTNDRRAENLCQAPVTGLYRDVHHDSPLLAGTPFILYAPQHTPPPPPPPPMQEVETRAGTGVQGKSFAKCGMAKQIQCEGLIQARWYKEIFLYGTLEKIHPPLREVESRAGMGVQGKSFIKCGMAKQIRCEDDNNVHNSSTVLGGQR